MEIARLALQGIKSMQDGAFKNKKQKETIIVPHLTQTTVVNNAQKDLSSTNVTNFATSPTLCAKILTLKQAHVHHATVDTLSLS